MTYRSSYKVTKVTGRYSNYICIKTTEKLNTSQITLLERYNYYIELVDGPVTKKIGLALFIQ